MPQTVFVQPMRPNASFDEVLEIFHTCLPEYGFKLATPPRDACDPGYAVASVWRRGEPRVTSHKAATAALALLLATRSELTKIQSASSMARCNRCDGVGWFVTNKRTFEICSHATDPTPM